MNHLCCEVNAIIKQMKLSEDGTHYTLPETLHKAYEREIKTHLRYFPKTVQPIFDCIDKGLPSLAYKQLPVRQK